MFRSFALIQCNFSVWQRQIKRFITPVRCEHAAPMRKFVMMAVFSVSSIFDVIEFLIELNYQVYTYTSMAINKIVYTNNQKVFSRAEHTAKYLHC